MGSICRSRDLRLSQHSQLVFLDDNLPGSAVHSLLRRGLRSLAIPPLIPGGILPHERLAVRFRTAIFRRDDRDKLEASIGRLHGFGARLALGRGPSVCHLGRG